MSTKKGDHGSNSSKKIASNTTKHPLQETEKTKTKKKPTDLELSKKKTVTSSVKLVNKPELSKYDKNKPRNPHTTLEKKNSLHAIKTKPEISSRKNTSISKELVDNKKERTPINLSNIKINSRITSNPSKVETKPNPTKPKINSVLPEFTKSIHTDEESNRPSTATLPHATVTNKNKVGPDNLNVSPSSKSDSSEDNKYEDDFESYESDFEEYSSSSTANLIRDISSSSSLSSSSEEPMSFEKHSTNGVILSSGSEDDKTLDSGNFEMQGYKHKPMLDNIKEAIEKENINISNYASFSDEGFEDHKSFQFVNFVEAQIKNKRRNSIQMRQKRGEEILSMVRLDCCSFTLIDLAPISYEMYVRNFGSSNTIQTSTQTGDDDIDEEIQTDEVEKVEKGTQQPEVFISYNKAETNSNNDSKNVKKIFNNKFLLAAFEVILKIQEEFSILRYNSESGPLSKSIANFKANISIFSNSHVTSIHFPSDKNDKFISVHSKVEGSLVTIWKISNCEQPESIIVCHGAITCCSIGVNCQEFIFTGLEDGAILVWNCNRNMNKDDLITTVPLFSTRINSGHHTKVIGLNFLGNSSIEEGNVQQTNELCSIDETGEIILWTILLKYSDHKEQEQNSKVTLVKNANISLNSLCPDMDYLHCTNFSSSILNPYYLFISTNYGSIIHYVIKAGINKVKQFVTGVESIPNSLVCCPFSSEYFLGGYKNGNLSLFARSSERPLIILSDKDKQNSAIEFIQWSKNKSTVIYSKDDRNVINIWDLDESDMMPVYTIPYKEEITAMEMFSTSRDAENKCPFMLIGTKQGNLYLHQLNEGEGQSASQLHNQSIKTFFNYVKRL
ncbi:unnamed protein product [Psylliodes chrysocephalus]|uniref:WD repeat-containing protein 60 n=1 Tax=Psylliodes chrysocephalus TaxID=3402493 RepID=A0A9P0CKP0_9CUCU|nr:unnamed protein product [Psylliodes chrysocephala]